MDLFFETISIMLEKVCAFALIFTRIKKKFGSINNLQKTEATKPEKAGKPKIWKVDLKNLKFLGLNGCWAWKIKNFFYCVILFCAICILSLKINIFFLKCSLDCSWIFQTFEWSSWADIFCKLLMDPMFFLSSEVSQQEHIPC